MRVSFKGSSECETVTRDAMIALTRYLLRTAERLVGASGFYSDPSVSVCLRSPAHSIKKLERFQIASFGRRGMICAVERRSKGYYASTSNHFVSNVQAQ